MPEDTFPGLLKRNYERYGNKRIAMWRKDYGKWQGYSWGYVYERIKRISLGLTSLGLKPQEKVAIIGDNGPEWYWAEFATQAAGGVALGIFTDAALGEVEHLAGHSDARFVIARDQEGVDKLLALRDQLPQIERIIYWESSGLWSYGEPMLMSLGELMAMGRAYENEHPVYFEESIEKWNAEDICFMTFTSGTTGLPKGSLLSYRALIQGQRAFAAACGLDDSSSYVSASSPSWLTEQIFGVTHFLMIGMEINFCEKPETVQDDLREVGPTMLPYPPPLWESLVKMVQAKISDAGFLNRMMFSTLLPAGYKIGDMRANHEKPSSFWRLVHGVADLLLFRPIRDSLGMLRCQYAATGGAAMGSAHFRFLRAVGVDVKNAYAISETGMVALQRKNETSLNGTGRPLLDREIRVSDEGELLVKSPGLFSGYYKNPQKTADILKNGWYRTGDAGFVTEIGELVIIDRVEFLMEIAGGSKFSPTYIENSLKFCPYVKDSVAIGGKGMPYITVLLTIDFSNTSTWAESKKIAFTTFADLSQKPEVYELIANHIKSVNKGLPESVRVRRFINLQKEFDADEAEMTRTKKIRREFVAKRYELLVNALHDENTEVVTMETEIKYKDGRVGKTSVPVKVFSVRE